MYYKYIYYSISVQNFKQKKNHQFFLIFFLSLLLLLSEIKQGTGSRLDRNHHQLKIWFVQGMELIDERNIWILTTRRYGH